MLDRIFEAKSFGKKKLNKDAFKRKRKEKLNQEFDQFVAFELFKRISSKREKEKKIGWSSK